jgi:hypothetical protein
VTSQSFSKNTLSCQGVQRAGTSRFKAHRTTGCNFIQEATDESGYTIAMID